MCGSLGLILTKCIRPREVNDIDFCCPPSKFSEDGMDLDGVYGKSDFGDYVTYKTTGDTKANGFYYNVFVHKDENFLEYLTMENGIKVQVPWQMLKYKLEFDRPKDRVDFQLHMKPAYNSTTSEIPF